MRPLARKFIRAAEAFGVKTEVGSDLDIDVGARTPLGDARAAVREPSGLMDHGMYERDFNSSASEPRSGNSELLWIASR